MSGQRHAQVVGVGLIGGSIAAALRAKGWHVTGEDADQERAIQAVEAGFLDRVGFDETAMIVFVATPVSTIADRVNGALGSGSIVTDVGSVKTPVTEVIQDSRFVGGHPMSGSERNGLAGVDPNLFEGATWILTPTEITDPHAYMTVSDVIAEMGARVLTLSAKEHDEIVATVSHVPHLVASSLMNVAAPESDGQNFLLRLAAGGFRDMTRIAAGDPDLWVDIVRSNRLAILESLERLGAQLEDLRSWIVSDDVIKLTSMLTTAAEARRELPKRAGRPDDLVVLRMDIPDSPGYLGEVFSAMAGARINVEDVEIAHGLEGGYGTLHLSVASNAAERAKAALRSNFLVSMEPL